MKVNYTDVEMAARQAISDLQVKLVEYLSQSIIAVEADPDEVIPACAIVISNAVRDGGLDKAPAFARKATLDWLREIGLGVDPAHN